MGMSKVRKILVYGLALLFFLPEAWKFGMYYRNNWFRKPNILPWFKLEVWAERKSL